MPNEGTKGIPAIPIGYGGEADLVLGELVNRMAEFYGSHKFVRLQGSPKHPHFDGTWILPVDGLITVRVVGGIFPIPAGERFVLTITAVGTPRYFGHQRLVRVEKGLETDFMTFLHQALADVDVQTLRFGIAAKGFQLLQQAAYGFLFLMPIVQRSRMRDNFKASVDAGIGLHIQIGKVFNHITGFSNRLSYFNFQLKTEVEFVFGAVIFCLEEVVNRLVAVVMNPVVCVFSFTIVAIPAAHLVMVHQMSATIAVRVIVVPAGQADMIIPTFDKVAVFIRGEVAAVMTAGIMPLAAVRANGLFPTLKPVGIF